VRLTVLQNYQKLSSRILFLHPKQVRTLKKNPAIKHGGKCTKKCEFVDVIETFKENPLDILSAIVHEFSLLERLLSLQKRFSLQGQLWRAQRGLP